MKRSCFNHNFVLCSELQSTLACLQRDLSGFYQSKLTFTSKLGLGSWKQVHKGFPNVLIGRRVLFKDNKTKMADPKAPSTKERLATIVQGFDTFDSEMKTGTRQRREKDEFKIAELKAEMKRLDGDLVAEIKRRTEMNKSTQMWFEVQLSELNKSFHETLDERTVKTTKRLDGLEESITALDARFEQEKALILRQIDERGQELARLLNEFKDEFERERVLRLEREERLVKQLTDQEYVTNERFESQIQTRETRYAAIRVILEDNIKLRDKAEERFSSFFEREIHKLHNDVRVETEVREREDDEIVEALNRYTMKLQSSLKIINSTD